MPSSPTEQLLEQVWDEAANPFTNTVKTTISRLRVKLGEPQVIETVREGGYRIAAPMATLMRHTLRFRLALLYSGVFFASGVVLLAIVVGLFSASRTTVPVPGQPSWRTAHRRRSSRAPTSVSC